MFEGVALPQQYFNLHDFAGFVGAERVVGFLPSMCKTLISISRTGEKNDFLAGS